MRLLYCRYKKLVGITAREFKINPSIYLHVNNANLLISHFLLRRQLSSNKRQIGYLSWSSVRLSIWLTMLINLSKHWTENYKRWLENISIDIRACQRLDLVLRVFCMLENFQLFIVSLNAKQCDTSWSFVGVFCRLLSQIDQLHKNGLHLNPFTS